MCGEIEYMRKAGKWLGTYKWPGAHLVWTKINLADVAARHSPQCNERSVDLLRTELSQVPFVESVLERVLYPHHLAHPSFDTFK